MTNDTVKHLEFIQSIITRMNTNSFQLKGWSVTISSALLAVYATTKNNNFILVSLFPVIVFWFLDAYYLMQERKFRGLYKDVAGISEEPKKLKSFEMRPDLYIGGEYCYSDTLLSSRISGLYIPLLIILLGLYYYL